MHYFELHLIWNRWKVVCSSNRPWKRDETGFFTWKEMDSNHRYDLCSLKIFLKSNELKAYDFSVGHVWCNFMNGNEYLTNNE